MMTELALAVLLVTRMRALAPRRVWAKLLISARFAQINKTAADAVPQREYGKEQVFHG